MPRNIGISYARGKYLTFVDSDDFITKTAIEEMYTVAKKFDADVVACEKYVELIDGKTSLKTYINRNFVNEPTLIPNDLSVRVAEMSKKNFIFSMCMKLIRKKFLLAENLEMINIVGEDALLTWCMLCVAKKYVLIPNVTYFYRLDSGSSMSRNETDVEKLFHKWFYAILAGFKYLDEFLSKQEFFKAHSDLKYIMFDTLFKEFNNYLLPIYRQIPANQLDDIIRKEISRADDIKALSAFMFSRMNVLNVNLNHQSGIINQLQAQLQK